MSKPKTQKEQIIHGSLHEMDHNEINQAALDMLDRLLERCTLNLISRLTQITRPTLYRWLDEKLPLDAMNVRDAAWFILICETSPRVQLLLSRPPTDYPRLAKRWLEDATGEKINDDA